MTDQAYEDLAGALDRLPGGFPRTKSGVEITILQKLFEPEEARLAVHLAAEPVRSGQAGDPRGLPAGGRLLCRRR